MDVASICLGSLLQTQQCSVPCSPTRRSTGSSPAARSGPALWRIARGQLSLAATNAPCKDSQLCMPPLLFLHGTQMASSRAGSPRGSIIQCSYCLRGSARDAGQPRSERTESHCVWIGRAKRVTAAAGRSHARPACWSACGLQCESNSATEFVSDNVHAPGAIQCPDLLQWKFELVVAKALKFAGVVAPGAWWEECQPWYLTASPSLAQFLWTGTHAHH
mmetsp:Transcript_47079/g.102385  ORF Transcript_47079/g.102385 Transcript_47079/m.102385 type:complete len:219 (+) Transcript_47079:1181-1837(+)